MVIKLKCEDNIMNKSEKREQEIITEAEILQDIKDKRKAEKEAKCRMNNDGEPDTRSSLERTTNFLMKIITIGFIIVAFLSYYAMDGEYPILLILFAFFPAWLTCLGVHFLINLFGGTYSEENK
jgi:hypothetical protein